MSAVQLPNEVWIQVFQHLGNRDLPKVCLCSHRFCELGRPLLYSQYRPGILRKHDHPTLHRAILDHPYLVQHVKYFEAPQTITIAAKRGLTSEITKDPWLTEPQETFICQLLLQVLPDRSETYNLWKEWRRAFEAGSWDAVIGILLLLCSLRVETIVINGYRSSSDVPEPSYPYIETVLANMKRLQDMSESPTPCMSMLRKVYLGQLYTEMPLHLVLPYLELKSVRELWTCCLTNRPNPELFQARSLRSGVINLTLQACNLDNDGLQSFLRCFPLLKRLQYTYRSSYEDPPRRPPNPNSCLSYLKNSLENLIIDAKYWDCEYSHAENDAEWDNKCESLWMKDLAQFTQLKKLEIAAPILIRWGADYSDENELRIFADTLPPNLETLTITSSAKGTWDFLAGIFRHGWVPPLLKRLRLVFRKDYRYVITSEDGVWHTWLYLEEAASSIGVDFTAEVTLKTGAW